MGRASTRVCPLCTVASIPVFRALCGRCFTRVPWRMRADLLQAWQLRASNPIYYNEMLIDVTQWYRDSHPLRERD